MLSGIAADLERALDYQKSFWRFVGIMTIVVLCVYLVILLVAIGGAFSSFSRF
jgi:hypothetical protein